MSLMDLFVAARRAVAERRRRRKARAELLALDEHTLADIGLRRAQIAGIIYSESEAEKRHTPVPATCAVRTRPAHHKTV